MKLFSLLKKREAQVIPKLSWQQYEDIDRAFETVPGVRLRYMDGQLEIMTIGPEHEGFKTTLRMLLEAYLRAKRIRFYHKPAEYPIHVIMGGDECCRYN